MLLWRVFDVNGVVCPTCGRGMALRAVVRSSGRPEARLTVGWMWPESEAQWGKTTVGERCVFDGGAHRKRSFSPGVQGARGTQSKTMRALGRGGVVRG